MKETDKQSASREALRRFDEARDLMRAADVAPETLRNLWRAMESTRAKAFPDNHISSPDAWIGGACSCGGDRLTVGSHYAGCRSDRRVTVSVVLPPLLGAACETWLRANGVTSEEVRHGVFPLGLVHGLLIDREAMTERVRAIAAERDAACAATEFDSARAIRYASQRDKALQARDEAYALAEAIVPVLKQVQEAHYPPEEQHSVPGCRCTSCRVCHAIAAVETAKRTKVPITDAEWEAAAKPHPK